MQDTHVQTRRLKTHAFPLKFVWVERLSAKQWAIYGYLIDVSLHPQGLLTALRSLHNAATKMRRRWIIIWVPEHGC